MLAEKGPFVSPGNFHLQAFTGVSGFKLILDIITHHVSSVRVDFKTKQTLKSLVKLLSYDLAAELRAR